MRLDRFLNKQLELGRQDVQRLLLQGRVQVDGQSVRDGRQEIDTFSRIEHAGVLLQPGQPRRYLMLHKPAGCVSATRDAQFLR